MQANSQGPVPSLASPQPLLKDSRKVVFPGGRAILSEEQRIKVYSLPAEMASEESAERVGVKGVWTKRRNQKGQLQLIKETIIHSGDKVVNITDIYLVGEPQHHSTDSNDEQGGRQQGGQKSRVFEEMVLEGESVKRVKRE